MLSILLTGLSSQLTFTSFAMRHILIFSFVLTGCWTPGKEGIVVKTEVLIPDQIANRAILLK